jgi:transposase
MLIPPGPIRVLMATKPVDFRKGMDGLAALVKEQLRADPFSGVIFCFRATRADRVKLIFWDGTGLCLFAKRLEGGKFRWPRIEDGVMRLSAAQLGSGLDARSGAACAYARRGAVACDKVNQVRVLIWQIAGDVLCLARGPTN